MFRQGFLKAFRIFRRVSLPVKVFGGLSTVCVRLSFIERQEVKKTNKKNKKTKISIKKLTNEKLDNITRKLKEIKDNEDITIILRDYGGSMAEMNNVTSLILNLRNNKRKIKCYIKDDITANRFRIAMACDEIYAVKDICIVPSTTTFEVGGKLESITKIESVFDSCNIDKKGCDDINFDWVILNYRIKLIKNQNKLLCNNIAMSHKYTEEMTNKIHDCFFKNTPDQNNINVNELQNFGIKINIIESQ